MSRNGWTDLHPAVAAILAVTNPRWTPPEPEREPDLLEWPDPCVVYHASGPRDLPERSPAEHARLHGIPQVRLPVEARQAIDRWELHAACRLDSLDIYTDIYDVAAHSWNRAQRRMGRYPGSLTDDTP